MKVRYSRSEDVLIIEFSDEKVDYAEEMGPVIVHFTKGGRPVMLEILDASEFVTEISKVAMRAEEKPIEVS
jgi:hypothetical protein